MRLRLPWRRGGRRVDCGKVASASTWEELASLLGLKVSHVFFQHLSALSSREAQGFHQCLAEAAEAGVGRAAAEFYCGSLVSTRAMVLKNWELLVEATAASTGLSKKKVLRLLSKEKKAVGEAWDCIRGVVESAGQAPKG